MRRKKIVAIALTATIALSMAACGAPADTSSSAASETAKVDEYVIEGIDYSAEPGKTYKRIKSAEFIEDFNTLVSLDTTEQRYYEDIQEIFSGRPGVHFKDFDDDNFAYYKWYSDDGNEVWITFRKVEDGKLLYYSWSSGTMDMEELEEDNTETAAEETSAEAEASADTETSADTEN